MAKLVTTYTPGDVNRMMSAAVTMASPGRLERLLKSAIQNAGRTTLTQVRNALHGQMGTKRKTLIFRDTRGFVAAGWAQGIAYTIEGRGKGLPITEFRAQGAKGADAKGRTWRQQSRDAKGRFGELPKTDKGFVTAYPWNVAHNFKRSFVAQSGAFKARLPDGKVRSLYGPAVAKEIVLGATAARFMSVSQALMAEHVGRRLARILP